MSNSFYPKMAVSNIKKNRKMYIPYIITAVITVMMYFMVASLVYSSSIKNMKHGDNIIMLLNVALVVALIFSVVFLFYTNSFLIKRRKKEIGLYNILGMEKRHIGKMMFFENTIIAVIALGMGIALGIVFGKLMFLLLMKLINSKTIPAFEIPAKAIVSTLILFVCVFIATFIYNLAKVHLAKPIELLHGNEIGEKEPKTKIIMTILGALSMGGGYWFALSVDSVMKAMNYFFVAVVFVIIGTYLLFTAGSIAIIKGLRKNKNFYYKTGHFTSVSGMLYRMKQNAVGLANICILSTMVLISVATTVSLYAGLQNSLNSAYPMEQNVTVNVSNESLADEVRQIIKDVTAKYNTTIKDMHNEKHTEYYGIVDKDKNKFSIVENDGKFFMNPNAAECLVITVDDYNSITGKHYTIENSNQIMLYVKEKPENSTDFTIERANDEISMKYQIKEIFDELELPGASEMSTMVDVYMLVVKDMDELNKINDNLNLQEGSMYDDMYLSYNMSFNTDLKKDDSVKLSEELDHINADNYYIICDNKYEMETELGQLYGGLLFIGIFVGLLFLMATVLIIYYKQISEGYEDRARYEIMMKVGMSRAEVKKTIRSQILMVFFIPLIMATIHVAVSFRIIRKMMVILSLGNTSLFILCTVMTVIVFSIIYALVFAITAKSYYNIVNGK